MESHSANLFAADGEMMNHKLWEGMQELLFDLVESNLVDDLKSKRTNENSWTLDDTMDLFEFAYEIPGSLSESIFNSSVMLRVQTNLQMQIPLLG